MEIVLLFLALTLKQYDAYGSNKHILYPDVSAVLVTMVNCANSHWCPNLSAYTIYITHTVNAD